MKTMFFQGKVEDKRRESMIQHELRTFPTSRPVFPRINSRLSGFFFCGIKELPVLEPTKRNEKSFIRSDGDTILLLLFSSVSWDNFFLSLSTSLYNFECNTFYPTDRVNSTKLLAEGMREREQEKL